MNDPVQLQLDPSPADWETILDDRGVVERCSIDVSDFDFRRLDFSQGTVTLFGKTYPEPRLTAYYGNHSGVYYYSGKSNVPKPFPDGLLKLKQLVEARTGDRFNSALCNCYRDGLDSMGWHADDESHYLPGSAIASVSFGATRDFVLRKKSNPRCRVVVPLHHGDLLVMRGGLFSSIGSIACPSASGCGIVGLTSRFGIIAFPLLADLQAETEGAADLKAANCAGMTTVLQYRIVFLQSSALLRRTTYFLG